MIDSPPLSAPLRAYRAIVKGLLWLVLGGWLALALAWGALHGWIVPRIGELRPWLETRATQALGTPVRIAAITASREGLLPVFELQDVVLSDGQGREAVRLARVLATVSPRSVWNRGFEQLYIQDPQLEIRRLRDGSLRVAGLDLGGASASGDGRAADWLAQQREVVVRGGALRWVDELRDASPLALRDVEIVMRNGGRRHALRLDATPPPAWGERFSLRGDFRQPLLGARPGQWRAWDGQAYAEFASVDLSQLHRHASLGITVASGRGAVRAWVDLSDGQFSGAVVDVALVEVGVTLGAQVSPLALDAVSGRFAGRRGASDGEFETRNLQFQVRGGPRWPGGNVRVAWSDANGSAPAGGQLQADQLDLQALRELAAHVPLGTVTHATLAAYAPRGRVDTLQARWQGPLGDPSSYSARGRVSGLEVAARPASDPGAASGIGATPGVRGLTADFDVTQTGGKARMQLQQGAVELPGVLGEPVAVNELAADLQWQHTATQTSVSVTGLRFANTDLQGGGQLSWRSGGPGTTSHPGVLDLQLTLDRAEAARLWRYLPTSIAPPNRNYVREAVLGGRLVDGRIRLRGDLRQFPFAQAGSGEFRVTSRLDKLNLAYAPRRTESGGMWPALDQLSGALVVDRNSAQLQGAEARLLGVAGLQVRADARIDDLRSNVLTVQGSVRGPLKDTLAVVNASPLSATLGDALAGASATGDTDLRLRLTLPLADLDRSRVEGSLVLAGNDVQITPTTPVLARARGTVAFNERGFNLIGVQARAFGGELRLEGGHRAVPAGSNEPSIVVRAQGVASAEGLRQAGELGAVASLARRATGQAGYTATVSVRRGMPEFAVTSNLQGLGLSLPAPFAKSAESALPLRLENRPLRSAADPDAARQDQLLLEVGRLASVTYERDLTGPQPRVLRGAIGIGLADDESAPLPEAGVIANINLVDIDVDAWRAVLADAGAVAPAAPARSDPAPPAGGAPAAASLRPLPASLGYLPTVLAVRARTLAADGRTLHDVVVGGSREGLIWRVNVDAAELNGYVEYRQPSGNGAGRVFARLARLSIEAATAREVEVLLDTQPGNIPALDVAVDEFELRGKKLGRLEIEAVNRGAGTVVREGGRREWRLNKLALTTPEAAFTATGQWTGLNAEAVPAGGPRPPPPAAGERRRTAMNFRLDMADAGQLLARFGMPDVVRRGRGRLEGQVGWIGSPLTLDYPTLQGVFTVQVEAGQFLKADPGLAKLLGVLSLQSLPRRLTLDFRDVFSDGFAFDFVRGDITIEQGIAATNNLQMKGVNAAVLMDGRADIARETQDLRVVVVPEINAGTASLVATVINPAIGLGTFLAQMFLREPLMRAATQEFHIDGTWADPRMTKVTRRTDPQVAPAPAQTGEN